MGTMRIPSPGIPVLVVPTITAQKATTTQPNKSKSNAHHPSLKSSDYLFKHSTAAIYRFWPCFAIDN
jgi:hypothetical protein